MLDAVAPLGGKVEVVVRSRRWRAPRAPLARFVHVAAAELRLRGEVTLLLATDGQMRALNRGFRGVDRTTDVLSFPGALGGGDVAIALGVAARQARRMGHPLAIEVRILALHGLLHLAGYDHRTDRGQMARREERLRRRLGLPTGLISRQKILPASQPRPASLNPT